MGCMEIKIICCEQCIMVYFLFTDDVTKLLVVELISVKENSPCCVNYQLLQITA